jgi:hypothetical protein
VGLGSSFLLMKPKNEARLLLRGLGDSAFFSSLGASSVTAGVSSAGLSSAATSSAALGASSAGFSSFLAGAAGLKLSMVDLYVSDSVTVATSSLASAILSFSWATQLSRSAVEAALKVCLLPLEEKWNLLVPSVSGSVASD